MTLSNENGGTGDYANTVSIKATGKLLTNQKVFFNTSAPTMHRDGSTDVVCTATATTATEWDATAVKGKTAQTDYSVTAHLTPGEWTGNMVFYASVGDTYTVEVGDNSVLLSPNSALCKSDTCAIRKLEKADAMRSLEILTILTINAELPHIV